VSDIRSLAPITQADDARIHEYVTARRDLWEQNLETGGWS
jgi:hypothetical protein